MLRRKSLCGQPVEQSLTETVLTNRTSSFTLRPVSNEPDGEAFIKNKPLRVDEPSPRRSTRTRFRFPGMGMFRAGFAGFRRHINAPSATKPCVWVDTPKDGATEIENLCEKRAKSTTALRDRCCSGTTEPSISADDIDVLINDAVFDLPRNGPLQRSMFTLSRLPETEATPYVDSLNSSPHGVSSRWEGQPNPSHRMRSSASSMVNATPRKGKVMLPSSSSSPSSSQNNPADKSNSENLYEQSDALKKQKEKLDAEYLTRLERRSISNVDFIKPVYGDPFSPTTDSPILPAKRPETRLDSRLYHGRTQHKSAANVATTGGLSDVSDSFPSTDSVCDQPTSFRSDQVLFHNSSGYKQLRMDAGFLIITGRSEENACIGKKAHHGPRFKHGTDLRRMKLHAVVDPASSLKASALPVHDDVGKGHREDFEEEVLDEPDAHVSARSKTSAREDDCSVLEEPRNLSMWLEWLEERSDVTRKEILYRMGCQKAFIQEAKEKLRSHALMQKDLDDVWDPKMKDRLAVIRRRCIAKARKTNKLSRRSCDVNAEEIADINLDEVDDVVCRTGHRALMRLSLNL